ncbi:hypothetical protein NQ314_005026 [Rhamnusium bicolor]|uniref:Histidine-rich glycoprotein-like n=1 Tax=Rhamnusium bicolor TaxID=1586634 RepID=A0AAV8ZKT6_9CUCU|nr:hypothetical protein NQ314_005026 [Rhamnusium bicolor]
MAQFVTHIQPTLMEASHHHIPHPHHHKDHHKDHHGKEQYGSKEHHGMIVKSPHKVDHPHDIHYKDLHIGHSRDYPVLPHTPIEHHQDVEGHRSDHKRDSGHYVDSHGVPHSFELHFIDSQGIYRDYHGHGIEADDYYKDQHIEKEKHHKGRKEDKSPFKEDSTRPIPPQFIDLNPVHVENKHVSKLFLFLISSILIVKNVVMLIKPKPLIHISK